MKREYIRKYSKEELLELNAVDVYKMVLSGRVNRFPSGFWQQPNSKDRAVECIKFLFNDVLQASDDEIKNLGLYELFIDNKLSTAIKTCFNWKTFDAFDAAFPNKFKPWEFKCVPSSFWLNDQHIKDAIKWLIEEKLELNDQEIREKFTGSLLEENGLSGMVQSSNKPIFELLDMAYPNRFKPWELRIVPNNYWDNENNKLIAMKWFIEEKLKLNEEDIKNQLSSNLFISNNLMTLLESFGGSPFKAINTLYPNKFKPWELKHVPHSFWEDKSNRVEAIKWLIEEKLKLNDYEVSQKVSQKAFREYGLASMLSCYFKGSPYRALNEAYPNKYKPWEFKSVPTNYWNNDKNIKDCIIWLIEEKLKLNDEQVKKEFSHKLLKNHGLDGLYATSKKSAFELLDIAYPNKYKAWEFKNVPRHYWDKKSNVINATKWLIEDKLNIDLNKSDIKLNRKDFDNHGLSTITRKHSLNSLINMAYPNQHIEKRNVYYKQIKKK